jgi:hypothetical protein
LSDDPEKGPVKASVYEPFLFNAPWPVSTMVDAVITSLSLNVGPNVKLAVILPAKSTYRSLEYVVSDRLPHKCRSLSR